MATNSIRRLWRKFGLFTTVALVSSSMLWVYAQERPNFRIKVDMVVLSFTVTDKTGRKLTGTNIIAEIKGTKNPAEIVDVVAHYDSVSAIVVGADDNGSGLAAALSVADSQKDLAPSKTVRFVDTIHINEHTQRLSLN